VRGRMCVLGDGDYYWWSILFWHWSFILNLAIFGPHLRAGTGDRRAVSPHISSKEYMVAHRINRFKFKLVDPVIHPWISLIRFHNPFCCFITLFLMLSSLTGLNDYYTLVIISSPSHLFLCKSVILLWHLMSGVVWSLKPLTFPDYIDILDILNF
jgi:hypothetical protein